MHVSTIARKLRNVFTSPNQWAKNTFKTDNGRMCLLGGARSLGLSPVGRSQLQRLMVAEAKSRGFTDVIDFNDAPRTKFVDVRSFLNAVVRRAKAA